MAVVSSSYRALDLLHGCRQLELRGCRHLVAGLNPTSHNTSRRSSGRTARPALLRSLDFPSAGPDDRKVARVVELKFQLGTYPTRNSPPPRATTRAAPREEEGQPVARGMFFWGKTPTVHGGEETDADRGTRIKLSKNNIDDGNVDKGEADKGRTTATRATSLSSTASNLFPRIRDRRVLTLNHSNQIKEFQWPRKESPTLLLVLQRVRVSNGGSGGAHREVSAGSRS